MGPVDANPRQLSALELLELRHLPDDGLQFEETLPIAWLKGQLGETTVTGEPLHVLQDGRLSLTVTPIGAVVDHPPVLLRGHIEASAQTPCVRCLEMVDMSLASELELTLFWKAPAPKPGQSAKKRGAKGSDKRKKKKSGSKGGGESAKLEDWSEMDLPGLDALDDGIYEEERIDLPAVLEEALLLALDMNPSCADEPACDQRTQALLDEVNRSAQEVAPEPDPRWAALRKMVETDSEQS